ncbi:hypothetical protein Cni_G23787 [Canna indica]|uniref:Uncharacterized protein n=1 Tax=Canna indica TaxID=4628 RepID=A0AAQ3QJH9_9LILI|nr:hypothetical protein Cni_G23787 [Canna indica]
MSSGAVPPLPSDPPPFVPPLPHPAPALPPPRVSAHPPVALLRLRVHLGPRSFGTMPLRLLRSLGRGARQGVLPAALLRELVGGVLLLWACGSPRSGLCEAQGKFCSLFFAGECRPRPSIRCPDFFVFVFS